jgi:thiosulfate/3-mercaptopyruvate sulfurtransferase
MAAPSYLERTEAFPNADLLWTPAQLKARLGDPRLALVDLRASHEVMGGVIPGAAHFDLYGIGLTQTTPALFDEFINLMRSLLGLRGVGMDKTVVFYEAQTGTRVARAFWLLEYFGHTDVHVLDGGMEGWRAAGFGTTQQMAEPHPSSLKIKPRKELFISADELNERLAKGEVQPLDTRADDEYYGRHKRAARTGAIPKAVHVEWVHYLDEQGRFKPPSQLGALFRSAGITPDKAVVPY